MYDHKDWKMHILAFIQHLLCPELCGTEMEQA